VGHARWLSLVRARVPDLVAGPSGLVRAFAQAASPTVASSVAAIAESLSMLQMVRRCGFPAQMAPGGVEPPHTDSKSVALSTELRGPAHARGWRMGLEPTTTWTTTRGSTD